MSISTALSNALSGLTANSRMTEVVSSNISNSLNEDYARRSVELSSMQLGGYGGGVRVVGVDRHVNPAVVAERRLADGDTAYHASMAEGLTRLEDIFGANGDGDSIADRVTRLEEALAQSAADPSSDTLLGVVLLRLQELTTSVNEASSDIQVMRYEADQDIASQVDTLNTSLAQLEDLNADIASAKATGQDVAGLEDQRQAVIDTISEITPVRELPRENGRVALMTTSGYLLMDGSAPTIEFTPVNAIVPDMTLESGGLSGLSINGEPVGDTGYGPLGGGSLQASFDMRDDVLVDAQADLDAFAADLIARFEDPAADPTLAPGAPGLFTDDGAPLDPLNTVALSQRLSVNSLVDPAAGGELWYLRDGLGATGPGPVGDATQLLASAGALTSSSTLATGGTQHGVAGHAAAISASVGSQRVAAEDELSFAAARRYSLLESEAAYGVDTDYELQMLMRIEQAYAANAKIIQTVDQLMQMIMEI